MGHCGHLLGDVPSRQVTTGTEWRKSPFSVSPEQGNRKPFVSSGHVEASRIDVEGADEVRNGNTRLAMHVCRGSIGSNSILVLRNKKCDHKKMQVKKESQQHRSRS